MSDQFVAIDVQGLDELGAKFDQLPPAVQDQVTEDVSDYLVNVLQLNPPQNYVTRFMAYGTTFFTDRQRRWFFWALNNGAITVPYERTQAQSEGWHKIGQGANVMVVNETPGVIFTRGDDTQSRHEYLVGWETTIQVIKRRADRIMEIANGAAKKAIRKLGLSK